MTSPLASTVIARAARAGGIIRWLPQASRAGFLAPPFLTLRARRHRHDGMGCRPHDDTRMTTRA